ncbi:hypothetical protein [Actinokineospora bangkokensis]|uniref:Uncharacterized protein n=1 Tax=Actinokineospora bangkokensis TaxID=1193682 RepID=A0A1Q9LLY2_9PSEU|nr:hypothetical protein [Actinokineospora bangkokensis]OLR93030.1 hypothetical protein BJP25_18925 [Actinokineospora bangkokensis]
MTTKGARDADWHTIRRLEVRNAAIIMWFQVAVSTASVLISVGVLGSGPVDLSGEVLPLLVYALTLGGTAVAAVFLLKARKWAWVLALVIEGLLVVDRVVQVAAGTANLVYVVTLLLPIVVIAQLVRTRDWFTR